MADSSFDSFGDFGDFQSAGSGGSGSFEDDGSLTPTGADSWSFASAGSRIAKPLRGGGAAGDAPHPTITSLQNEGGAAPAGKRSSWFFQKG